MSSEEESLPGEGPSFKKPSSDKIPGQTNSEEEMRFTRPALNPNVEGILKGELVEVLESKREKILTAEQQRVLARQEILVRQREREFHEALEAQKVAEFKILKKAEEDKMIRIQEEKNAIILERVAQRDEKRRKAREEKKAKEEMKAYLLTQQANAQSGWYNADGDVGEASPRRASMYAGFKATDQEQARRSEQRQSLNQAQTGQRQSKGNRRSTRQSGPYGGTVQPMTELPGEYEDGVWSDAEDYGYSKEFPYPKKDLVINEDQEIKEEFPVDNPYKDIEHLLVVDDTGSSSERSSEKSPISTGRLEGLEKGIHYIDKAAAELQTLLGKIADYDGYSSRTPVNTATKDKKKRGKKSKGVKMALELDIQEMEQELDAGESEYDISHNDVGTEVKALTLPGDVNPNMVDKSTQVRSRDILMEYKTLLQAMSRYQIDEEIAQKQQEELDAEAAIEEYIFRLERKESLRRDAMTLTRPLGYRELDLSVSNQISAAYDAETQVNEKMMDTEYAMKKGLVLSEDDILWPSVGSFDIEFALKRIQDYITQCWKLDPKWMFDIKPVQTISDDYRKRYIFEAKFSIPTQHHPVPTATASVFFIMEVSHYAPKEDVVKVHYVIEGNRFLHSPGVLPFQDRWLWSVITDKNRIIRAVDF